jgi:tetratricopeptide (TPR) repeat protein
MKRFPFLIACLLALPCLRAAADTALFVTSVPLRARIILDGAALGRETPALVRGIPAGKHALVIDKDGFLPVRVSCDVAEGESTSVTADLGRTTFSVALAGEKAVRIGGTDAAASGSVFRLPTGPYSITREAGRLSVLSLSPLQAGIDAATAALSLSAAVAGASAVQDVLSGTARGFVLSPVTWTACAATALFAVLDASLAIGKAVAAPGPPAAATPWEGSEERAAERYAEGERLLELGRLEDAAAQYLSVVEGNRESAAFPPALYKLARIHLLAGRVDLSLAELGLLTDRFPVPDLYDKALKAQSDIALSRGEYARSVAFLDAMVLADPLFVREEVLHDRCRILAAQADAAPDADRAAAIAAFRGLLDAYPGVPLYRYELAVQLAAAGRDGEARTELGRLGDGADPQLAAKAARLLSSLGKGD